MVIENRVLRIFGLKRDEVTGGWRKLHNEKFRDLYSLPSIIRMVKENETGGACSMNGEKRNAYRLLVEKPEGKRPRPRWILGWGCVDWIGVAQDKNWWRALVNSILNLRVP
jgi:hypothetical protein